MACKETELFTELKPQTPCCSTLSPCVSSRVSVEWPQLPIHRSVWVTLLVLQSLAIKEGWWSQLLTVGNRENIATATTITVVDIKVSSKKQEREIIGNNTCLFFLVGWDFSPTSLWNEKQRHILGYKNSAVIRRVQRSQPRSSFLGNTWVHMCLCACKHTKSIK